MAEAIAGAFGGVCGVIVGSPLDVVAVRLQQAGCTHRGPFDCISSIVRTEGPRALLKGASYPLLTVALQNSLCFHSFGAASRYLAPSRHPASYEPPRQVLASAERDGASKPLAGNSRLPRAAAVDPLESTRGIETGAPSPVFVGTPAEVHTAGASVRVDTASSTICLGAEPLVGSRAERGSTARGFPDERALYLDALSRTCMAGAFAGGVQTIVSVPQELLKIRMQVQAAMPGQDGYRGPLTVLGGIVNAGGLPALYRGLGLTLMRDVPSYAVYFAVNQVGKDLLEPAAQASGEYTAFTELMAGGAAGSIAWASIYPIEVIKTRVQATSQSWKMVVKKLVAEEGYVALTRGMSAVLSRAFVVNAAIFYGFSLATRALNYSSLL